MLSVAISVNGNAVIARSAHRRTARHSKGDESAYLLDSGELVYHNRDDGIVSLAIKMLQSINPDDIGE